MEDDNDSLKSSALNMAQGTPPSPKPTSDYPPAKDEEKDA